MVFLATSGARVTVPSGRALAAFAPLLALLLGLVVYCLVDLIRAPAVRNLSKPVWALVIVLAGIPLGAILYLAVGKERYATGVPRRERV